MNITGNLPNITGNLLKITGNLSHITDNTSNITDNTSIVKDTSILQSPFKLAIEELLASMMDFCKSHIVRISMVRQFAVDALRSSLSHLDKSAQHNVK